MRLAFILVLFGILSIQSAFAQDPDLPGAPQNNETIPAGSLIIPMGLVNQNLGADDYLFNLKAYGAVNNLLQNEIPVKWAIRYNKTKLVGTAEADDGTGLTLTDANAFGDVSIGDIVTNISDEGSWGVVVSKTNSVLTLDALRAGSGDGDWESGDGYVVDQNDFSAPVCAATVNPCAGPGTSTKFSGGPFIVPAAFADTALSKLTGFGNNVTVFKTASDFTADIRYTLTQRPFIAISEVNTKIHEAVMNAAGIPGAVPGDKKDDPYINCLPPGDPGHNPLLCNWNQVPPEELTNITCATIHMEPHRKDDTVEEQIGHQQDVLDFVNGGGNFLAQCHAVVNFEGLTTDSNTPPGVFLTTLGAVKNGINEDLLYPQASVAFSQFTGALDGTQGGSIPDWTLGGGNIKGSVSGYYTAQNKTSTDTYQAMAGKLLTGAGSGGNVFYLGGHEYKKYDESNDQAVGNRMALNTIFVPADRPSECGFDFGTPELTLVKGATPALYNAVSQTISYTYDVTNSGSLLLAGPVTVADDKLTVSCPDVDTVGNLDDNLDPGETLQCTASYDIIQADIDAGSITNVATASADGTDSNEDTETVNAVQNPDVSLDKGATPPNYNTVGQVISYTYDVTNSGNVTLDAPVTVADDKVTVNCPTLGDGKLDPGETTQCTASHVITQADIDAGSITNVAMATVDGVDSNEDNETVNAIQNQSISLVKNADPSIYSTVGQTINYTYDVTNTGNVTLDAPVTVADDKVTVNCPTLVDGKLDPGETTQCTASHVIDQDDLDDGFITNVAMATVDGIDSNEDTETVNAVQDNGLILIKNATPPNYDTVGQVINYTYDVTNSGNITLAGPVVVNDDQETVNCPTLGDGNLDPGETTQCTASHVITQDDIDAGSITNVAMASVDGVDSNQDNETVNANQNKSLTLDKKASPKTYSTVGQIISYTYDVTNSGNVTLAGPVTVADDKETVTCPVLGDGKLDPGETTQCTTSHVITQDDIDAGFITNVARATADGVDSNQDNETVNAITDTGVVLAKHATPSTYSTVGQVISYTYEVTNIGNITLAGPVTVVDDKATVTCPLLGDGQLDPGETLVCTAAYVITQADIDAGSVTNVAKATVEDVDSNEDDETVTSNNNVILTLDKTASPLTYENVGDVITYSYKVTNNGNVTLYAPYKIDDNKSVDEACPPIPTALVPGASVTCSATYTITQNDLNQGSVTNVATATAQDAEVDGNTVNSNQDSATVTAINTANINLAKTVNGPATLEANGTYTVVYTIRVTNNGSRAGTYDLEDSFELGSGITLNSATATYVPGTDSTQTGTLGVYPIFVTDEGLPAGLYESWTVTGNFTVNPAEVNPNDSECDPNDPVINTGFYNLIEGVTNEEDTDDNDTCTSLLEAEIDLSKESIDVVSNGGGSFTVTYLVRATNKGQGPGLYNLVDTIDPGTGISVATAKLVSYNAGSENSQSGVLSGALPYTFSSGATLVTNEALAGGRDESWTIVVDFTVNFTLIDETYQCSSIQGPAGHGFYNRIDGSATDLDLTNNETCVNPPINRTTFRVTKDFSDDNPMGVKVEISCNTGKLLDQEKVITENDDVTFVVTDFEIGTLNCDITEVVPDGYKPGYTAGSDDGIAGSISDDAAGCHFKEVVGGGFSCHIVNTPDKVKIIVRKEWIDDHPEYQLSTNVYVTLHCDARILHDPISGNAAGLDNTQSDTGSNSSSAWINPADPGVWEVIPPYDGSKCYVTEEDSGEFLGDTSDCDDLYVEPGKGDSCTVVNTRLFQGIPTLNQYGLLLMALLMFALGGFAVRRFA